MQNALSLAAPSARHSFRQAVVAGRIARAKARDEADIKLFALAFSAFFVCFYTFIF